MALTQRHGRRRSRSLERRFLCLIGIGDLAVMLDMPFARRAEALVVGQSHSASPPNQQRPDLMRVGPLPSLQIVLGHLRALLLFGIALPGLVRLLEGTLIGPLPRV